MANLGRSIFELGYELSPVILTNGIAQGFPGSMMPIILLTQATGFIQSVLTGNNPFDTSKYFAHFRPLPGSTLVNNESGKYPFANQSVAANAMIAQPLNLSMLMLAPVNQPGGYVSKLVTFTALKTALDNHVQQGGTFTIATPAFIYTNCLLLHLTDETGAGSKQAQTTWRFDFERPLLSLDQATQTLNTLMSKISGGLPFSGSGTPPWSGIDSAIGAVKTGLGALGSGNLGIGSFDLSSAILPGGISLSDLSNVSNSLIGTAVSGIQSTVGNLQTAVSNLRLP